MLSGRSAELTAEAVLLSENSTHRIALSLIEGLGIGSPPPPEILVA